MIDAIVNFAFDVGWMDDYRLRAIDLMDEENDIEEVKQLSAKI